MLFFSHINGKETPDNEYIVHHAKIVEHAEIAIIAATAEEESEGSESSSSKSTLLETPTPREHEIFAGRVKKAKLVLLQAKSVDDPSNVVEAFSLSVADTQTPQRENPLPHDSSPPTDIRFVNFGENWIPPGKMVHLLGNAEKVLKADNVMRADIVIRSTKLRVNPTAFS